MTGDPTPLFHPFEKMPDRCSAVYATFENMDRIAAYFADEFNVTTTRSQSEGTKVDLFVREGPPDFGHVLTIVPGVVVIYGHPPTAVPAEEFRAGWRKSLDPR